MRLRYAGTCGECGASVDVGEQAIYFREMKLIRCLTCTEPNSGTIAPAESVIDATDSGTPGASARREHQRRVNKREERIRAAHPKLGGLILALTDEPQTTDAWQRGARGEELLGKHLNTLTSRGVLLLHDRRIPGTRANIDHIAVSSAGVFVIDAKRYRGRPHLRVEGGLLRPRTQTLLVGRRDCTTLVHSMNKQTERVRTALATSPEFVDVPVRGMLCFIEADWPLIGGSFTTDGVDVLWPNKATEKITAGGQYTPQTFALIHRHLANAFPTA